MPVRDETGHHELPSRQRGLILHHCRLRVHRLLAQTRCPYRVGRGQGRREVVPFREERIVGPVGEHLVTDPVGRAGQPREGTDGGEPLEPRGRRGNNPSG
ncbi:hypothetical protein ACFY1J_11470 [Streptomyces sp. NPDC001406]|uniref:hypothetical protein n=1 Tax=Streptomyces sp. NPDC001406 TaxID=3364572 RepID=UPI003696AECB